MNFVLMSKYRAIIFDLDGTAVENRIDALPSHRLIDAVRRAKNSIHLIAATGRPYAYAQGVIEALELTTPCIFSGGTNIIQADTGALLSRTTLPAEAIGTILEIIQPTPYNMILDDEPKDLKRGANARIRDDVDIIFIEDVTEDDAPAILQKLQMIPGITAATVPSWNYGLTFTITSELATKEHAIKTVLQGLGVPRATTIGIGDGNNDVHLFAAVGLKIAMGNATLQLKQAADEITGRVDDDGLAQIIEKYAWL